MGVMPPPVKFAKQIAITDHALLQRGVVLSCDFVTSMRVSILWFSGVVISGLAEDVGAICFLKLHCKEIGRACGPHSYTAMLFHGYGYIAFMAR